MNHLIMNHVCYISADTELMPVQIFYLQQTGGQRQREKQQMKGWQAENRDPSGLF